MQERKFEGVCWSELAIVWQLPTATNDNTMYASDYEKLQYFLYVVWKRTLCKKKSYIRKRVANDIRQYAYALSNRKDNIYRYIWSALVGVRDDKELIKITIALVPYMWY